MCCQIARYNIDVFPENLFSSHIFSLTNATYPQRYKAFAVHVVQKIGAAAYQQAGPEMGGAGTPPDEGGESPGDGDEDVVEGEFKDADGE